MNVFIKLFIDKAATTYISIQEDKNINLMNFQSYIFHRLYPNIFKYHYKPKDDLSSLLLPSGYESDKTLEELKSKIIDKKINTIESPEINMVHSLDPDEFIDSIFKNNDKIQNVTRRSYTLYHTDVYYINILIERNNIQFLCPTPTKSPKEKRNNNPKRINFKGNKI